MTPWTEVHGLRSPSQYERLERGLRDADDVNETAVRQPYSGSAMFDERWFVVGDGSTWRLVAPDPPFRGVVECVMTAPQLPISRHVVLCA